MKKLQIHSSMHLLINNCPKNRDELFIRKSLCFFENWLFKSPRIHERFNDWKKGKTSEEINSEILEVEVTFQKNLLKHHGSLAECCPEDDARPKGFHRHKEYDIVIDADIAIIKQLRALAHELVHIKQYSQGELRLSTKSISYSVWRGKTYDDSQIDYFNTPWEIEAYGREFGMVRRWIESRTFRSKFKKYEKLFELED